MPSTGNIKDRDPVVDQVLRHTSSGSQKPIIVELSGTVETCLLRLKSDENMTPTGQHCTLSWWSSANALMPTGFFCTVSVRSAMYKMTHTFGLTRTFQMLGQQQQRRLFHSQQNGFLSYIFQD